MQRNVAGDCGIPFSVIRYSWKKMEQVPQGKCGGERNENRWSGV